MVESNMLIKNNVGLVFRLNNKIQVDYEKEKQ